MSQIEKNTVKATNQLKDKYIFVHEKENSPIKILFLGNSITLHGVKEDIGWYNAWGMAASSEENDYVHLVMSELEKSGISSSFCIGQISSWETQYQRGSEILDTFEEAREFNADIIIMRFIENCSCAGFDINVFEDEYKKLIDYFNPNEKAKVILTTGFWKHPGDSAIIKTGKERNYPCIYLGDLGEDDKMKAIGLFEHSGVANHPGDLGMRKIADLILNEIKNIL